MDSTATTPFVTFLNVFVLSFLGTALVGYIAKIVLQWILTEIGLLKCKIKLEDWDFIKGVVSQGVQFAEQTGLVGEIKKGGAEKVAECIGYVNSVLAQTSFKEPDVKILTHSETRMEFPGHLSELRRLCCS